MDDLKTFEFGADVGLLKSAFERGRLPGHLEPPFRAMVSDIVARVSEKPISIYLCSPEEDAEARNLMGFFLTRLVREHISTVLLVDCDFLSVGMTGIIPHRDALGFLDLLLYGTSLGVISQEAAHGVRIVGAGSFPVTKKSPFAMDSFESARRYLANQAKCVIFCGPVLDDENQIHPLVETVDLAALVRVGEHFDPRFLDPFEEKLSALDGREAWSVRLDKSISVDDEAPGLETREDARKAQPTLVAEVEDLVERAGLADGGDGESKAPPASAAAPKEKAEASREKAAETKAAREKADQEKASMKAAAPPHRPEQPPGSPSAERAARTADRGPQPARRLGGSKVFRIATISVAVMLVVFVFWWLYLTKPVRERHQAPVGPAEEVAQTQTAADTARAEPEPPASVETPPAETPPETQTVETVEEPELTDDGAGAIPKPTDVVVSETLDPYANQYLIHVSSFRALENAKDEAFYLLGWGYPVFIYRADLGNKGMWYRVYVGPSETRAEAREYKIKLDENRRIKSTRIARVPG